MKPGQPAIESAMTTRLDPLRFRDHRSRRYCYGMPGHTKGR